MSVHVSFKKITSHECPSTARVLAVVNLFGIMVQLMSVPKMSVSQTPSSLKEGSKEDLQVLRARVAFPATLGRTFESFVKTFATPPPFSSWAAI